MAESKYWSLKPFYSKLAFTSNEKKLVKYYITLTCQVKIIKLLIFFDPTNSSY